jgi:hypothetical protein
MLDGEEPMRHADEGSPSYTRDLRNEMTLFSDPTNVL